MATPEQKKASAAVMDAVKTLNRALSEAHSADLFVELRQHHQTGGRNGHYLVETIEARETVLP